MFWKCLESVSKPSWKCIESVLKVSLKNLKSRWLKMHLLNQAFIIVKKNVVVRQKLAFVCRNIFGLGSNFLVFCIELMLGECYIWRSKPLTVWFKKVHLFCKYLKITQEKTIPFFFRNVFGFVENSTFFLHAPLYTI